MRKSILASTILLLSHIPLASQTRDLRVEPINSAEQRAFEKQVKVALVVGISAYPQGSGLSSLKYAARDAEVLGGALKSQGYLVRQLTESDATRAVIRRSLRELAEVVSPNEGTILFFFGGHGFTYKETNYLATFGVTADDLDGEGLAVKDVEELLRASKAKRKLLFIDACRNDPGQAARSTGQRSFEKLQAAEGMRVLFSTKEGRVSFEDDALRQGVFTYFLAKGLAGEAAGADGLVTFRDLSDYVTDRMRAYTVERGQVQVPFEAGESNGDFLLSAGSSGVRVPPGTPAPVAQPKPLNQPPAGFTTLFDGQDLSGWRGRQGDFDPRAEAALPPAELTSRQAEWNRQRELHWRVEAAKGEIVADGQRIHLATMKDYGDFELYVDWLVSRNADSGIYLRGYPQVQIWDPEGPDSLGQGSIKGSGGLYNNGPNNPAKWPLVKADNPVGQWNTFHIIMVGSRVSVWLNERLVVDGQVLENFFDRNAPLVSKGPIELQGWRGEVRFRNIYIREMHPAK